MKLKILHPGKLSLFTTLSVVDFYLTYRLVQQSGGRVYESNPIAHAWLSDYGWPGLLFFKLIVVLLVGAVCLYISLHRPRLGGSILMFGCMAVAAVVVYSCSLAGFLGGQPGATGTVFAHAGEHRHREAATPEQEAYLALWRRLRADVIAGKRGLIDATKELTEAEETKNPLWLDELRERFPGTWTDEARLAANLISYVTRSLKRNDNPEVERITAQLKADFLARYGESCPIPSGGRFSLHRPVSQDGTELRSAR